MKLYYSISEASKILGVKPYILRYWENELRALRPKRKHGKRFYTINDLKTALVIKNLLYNEGYTLSGARKKIREEGVEHLLSSAVHSLLNELREELEELFEEIRELKKILNRD
jgi:DNA-binding transcriptional MerR regulator